MREASCAEAEQRGQVISPKERHHARGETAQDPDAVETLRDGKLVGNAAVPGRVFAVKELHAPRLLSPAQPAVLGVAFASDGGVGESQLPIGLSRHIHLPVMATAAEALQADGVEGGVKTPGEVRQLLPGVGVSGAVAPG